MFRLPSHTFPDSIFIVANVFAQKGHSRAGGNPVCSYKTMYSRLRGNEQRELMQRLIA